MKAFFDLNREKFKFLTKVLFIGFGIMMSCLYFIPSSDDPGIFVRILGHLLGTVATTLSAGGVIFLAGYHHHWKQLKLFGKKPLKAFFEKYDFRTDLIYTNYRWELTQEIKVGYIAPYHISIFLFPAKSNHITTAIELNWSPNDDAQSRELEARLKKEKMNLVEGEVLHPMKVTDNIEAQIIRMIELLKSERLRPVSLNAWYFVSLNQIILKTL